MTPAATLAFARAVASLAAARANLAVNPPETTIDDAYYAMFRVARDRRHIAASVSRSVDRRWISRRMSGGSPEG